MSPLGLAPLPFKSLRELVAANLRKGILEGILKPGQRIMDAEVAAEMGISRSPVREALRLLEKDGLVRSVPNRGTVVIELCGDDLVQLYGIRAVLEGLAAAWACRHITESQIEEQRNRCRAMEALFPFASDADRVEFLRKDVEFHRELVSAARSPRLSDALQAVHLQIQLVMAAGSVLGSGAVNMREHDRILDAVAQGDTQAAECLARRHVEDARDRLLQVFAQHGQSSETS